MADKTFTPRLAGVRLPWSALPRHLMKSIEEYLGAPIDWTHTPAGGFSPGVVSRVRAANGARLFIKAVSAAQNPDSPGIYRREAALVTALPASAPVPRLLWWHDDGEDGWVMLVFEDIDGHMPHVPWRDDELERVVRALINLARILTPAPTDAPSAVDAFAQHLKGWEMLLEHPSDAIDDWSRRHLHRLADLESAAPAAVAGETLLHFDTRADNLLLTDDQVYVVDWPAASIGAAWVDRICMAPSVAMEGGPAPEEFVNLFPDVRAADAAAVTAVIASMAGYFTHRSLQPPPPGLPTVRAFQAAQGEVARAWLVMRLGMV